ncbi:unnamed protein product (macronuclear) [Paramecium tetraurelia]|uniref:Protein kinase domain-containing protein n=1 Tax=Paramecium tetraurelia TaxID=5888 RepID=A0C0C4_PARTE|nr:uncharacterized protein GSPATT00006094001 [Paramecium tetraurelia]CAK64241.1 unnamed protein product [Paramecium tetraurelia]|eukprot:XP_001431639.1 hypothetical protein (macronuclear) [Paramecium tetraurelia strain d4-2]
MSKFSCSGLYASNQGEHQEVMIITQSGDLQIVSKSGNEQMVYLPSNSMDTILCFAREVDQSQQSGTFDLLHPESQIRVSFLLNLKDIEQLRVLMRGKQVFLDTQNYVVLGKLASDICNQRYLTLELIQARNRIQVQKKASLVLKDSVSRGRLGQLRQEAKMLRLLKDYRHKNIILLEEIITDCRSVSIVLEYCQGGDLLQLLQQKSFDIDVPRLMLNLLSGLKHLHDLEVVHRDIKLQNILFKDSKNMDTLKIADFGFSCLKSQISFINPICGTPGYTAPEVFSQSSSYDEKVDIYSAGIIFYNILTSKNPFGNSKNISDLIQSNISGNYNQAYLESTYVNNPLAYDLLTKMLQKEPHSRPSADECLNHPYFKIQINGDFRIDDVKEKIQIKRKSKKQKREAQKQSRM